MCQIITKMKYLLPLFIILAFISCSQKQRDKEETPWGTVVGNDGTEQADTTVGVMTLSDIVAQGEMIMLTLNGPKTYYDYHGHGMGLQYLLCEKLAQKLGVKLRVEVCKDSLELIKKLRDGQGDIIAYPITDKEFAGCGPSWAVNKKNDILAKEINQWYKPEMVAEMEKMEKTLIANGGVIRHIYSPFANRQKGIISRWDGLFQKHAPTARLDWRLMAAQCYQESCFDPKAHSWAGACGLMQIMPSTAKQLGLAASDIYTPEHNIAAAARYMALLMNDFRDVPTMYDRICFALASYNGGERHVRDAMALARKYGKSDKRWQDVRFYVLNLANAQYYTDPVVKAGYMRGTETSSYVDRIMKRWQEYGGNPHRTSGYSFSGYTGPSTQPSITGTTGPKRAKKKSKYSI